jgi:hypothetical protein
VSRCARRSTAKAADRLAQRTGFGSISLYTRRILHSSQKVQASASVMSVARVTYDAIRRDRCDRWLSFGMLLAGTFLNAKNFWGRTTRGFVKRTGKMTFHLDLREDDPHSKRITFDTAEWHRRLEELATLRQLETSPASPADEIVASRKLA